MHAKPSTTSTCKTVSTPPRHLAATALLACVLGVLQACSGADATAPGQGANAPATPATVAPLPTRLTRLGPDTLTAGGTLVIQGERLPVALGDVRITIGGMPLAVTAASASRIEAVIPATGLPCGPAAVAKVHLQLGTTVVDTVAIVATATRLALAPGESARLLGANQARCVELAAPANGGYARYVIAVVNTSTDPTAATPVDMRGTGVGAMAGLVSTSTQSDGLVAHQRSSLVTSATLPADAQGDTHHTHLAQPAPTPAWPVTRTLRAIQAPLSIGDTVAMTALLNSCVTGHPVKARVVYAGTRAVLLEDLKAPRGGRNDAGYAQIGREYDAVVHPLITQQIGNPLAMDAQMGGDGRITMLFTPFVNDSAPGTAAYVSACNFYPRSTFAASNQNEVLYARVASAQETPDEWRRALRSTVVHEAKHLASFAERLANGHPFEESWLEEATARIAEELYSRTFPEGGAWKGAAGFSGSVACELLMCDDRPLIMWKHFAGLSGYLRAVDAMSPLGGPGVGSSTTYGSGWALVRWITDRYAANESAWLKALVRGGQGTGLRALAQAAGRSEQELLADWSLTLALDDAAADDTPGGTMARLQTATPSWRVGDMMAGLAQLFPGAFDARPLKVRRQSFGSFRLPVSSLPGFASRFVSLEGAQSGSQLVELVSGQSASPLRAVIVRVR